MEPQKIDFVAGKDGRNSGDGTGFKEIRSLLSVHNVDKSSRDDGEYEK